MVQRSTAALWRAPANTLKHGLYGVTLWQALATTWVTWDNTVEQHGSLEITL